MTERTSDPSKVVEILLVISIVVMFVTLSMSLYWFNKFDLLLERVEKRMVVQQVINTRKQCKIQNGVRL